MSAKLLTIEDLSGHLGIPVAPLYKWNGKGYGPQARKMGKYLRYHPEDVDAWVESQGTA